MKIQGVSGERKERDVVDGTAGLSLGSQFAVLLRMQLAHFRSVWRRYIIVSSAMPLGITLLLRLRGPAPHSQAVQFVAGGVTLTVALSTLTFLAQRVAWMKSNKTFDYYNTLPLSTAVLLLAMLVSYFVFAIPGILAITVIGSLIFSLPLEPSIDILWAMATLFLTGVALAGIGALIGLRARNEQLAGAYANIAMMAVLLLSIIPFSDLPGL
ncbi:MAG TPA: ABC transporter permease, partial [Chloroflexota bacterium]|nr:ABC transporter permease [Chloroflexota bacterium]